MAYKKSEATRLKDLARNKLWVENNRERARETVRRSYKKHYGKTWMLAAKKRRYMREYGISYDTFLSMFEQQEGLCACCSRHMVLESSARDVTCACVDHDHKTGQVRGLLCRQCNAAIGILGDSASRLRSAASYLDVTRDWRNRP